MTIQDFLWGSLFYGIFFGYPTGIMALCLLIAPEYSVIPGFFYLWGMRDLTKSLLRDLNLIS